MRLRRIVGPLACALVAASCSGKVVPAGGIFLVMCTDGTLAPDSLSLVVRSSDGTPRFQGTYGVPSRDIPGLPASLAIESNAGAGASVSVDVSISKGGTLLDARHYEIRRISADRVSELDIVFTKSCTETKCEGATTCSANGTCASNEMMADSLPPYAGDAGAAAHCKAPVGGDEDASGAMDAGADASPDVSVGPDSGLDAPIPDDGGIDVTSEDASDAGAAVDAGDGPANADAGPLCRPLAERCVANQPQTCDPNGHWINAPSCVAGKTHCSGVRCEAVPPSCADAPPGAGFDCSAAGNADCCASYDVAGGTFFRDYDGHLYTDRSYPATVSSFRLDAYEITVGRFRQFAHAVVAGWRPVPGSGKHEHLNKGSGLIDIGEAGTLFETGWDASWTANLPTTSSGWNDALACLSDSTATWTPNQGLANERLPLTCIDWYAAYAFCIWDGGFLPSSAEWNYAATGGAEQRVYAWGNDDPLEDTTLAIWGCHYGGGLNCDTLAAVAPVGTARAGDGRWGQSDLTGSVWEWVFDFHADRLVSCVDCAATTGVGHFLRGAAFDNYIPNLPVSYREWSRDGGHLNLGARCARAIP